MAAFVSQNATGGGHLPSKSRVFPQRTRLDGLWPQWQVWRL